MILVVIGTRPEAIKLGPVVCAMREAGVPFQICLTGQHTGLLSSALTLFDLSADYVLDITSSDNVLFAFERIRSSLQSLIDAGSFSLVIVQGDTTSAAAGAMAARNVGVPIAHVEAGLRSGNLNEPRPEEFYRRLISRVSSLHFAPTDRAKKNLLAEGICPSAIVLTGNPGIDALHLAIDKLNSFEPSEAPDPLLRVVPADALILLFTVHRHENLVCRLIEIEDALMRIIKEGSWHVVFPAHPNPRLAGLCERLRSQPRMHVVAPLDYVPFVALMRRATLFLTDSGGIQEESAALGKPCLVLRECSERPEIIERGNGLITGGTSDGIVHNVLRLLQDPKARDAMCVQHDSFGDGQASRRIVNHLAVKFREVWV